MIALNMSLAMKIAKISRTLNVPESVVIQKLIENGGCL